MNLIRLIVIALIIYLIIQIIKRWLANKKIQPRSEVKQNQMVRCEVCQLHVPKNEAVQKEGKYYCCQDHYEGKQN